MFLLDRSYTVERTVPYLGLDVLSRSRLTLIPTDKEEPTTELGALSA
jgi:hypothetical protein